MADSREATAISRAAGLEGPSVADGVRQTMLVRSLGARRSA